MTETHSLYFTAPRQVAVCAEDLPAPSSGQVLVRAICSAISPGTEALIYRGQFPAGLAVDSSIAALAGEFAYPLKYGYSMVGQVQALGPGVEPEWLGQQVFAFQPHQAHFLASPGDLIPLPAGVSPEQAVFLPNLETALNFVMDAAPLIGERVVVFGQGIVGLLTTALLARFPLAALVTLDRYPRRRQAGLESGAHASLDPDGPETAAELARRLPGGADLALELSGAPAALDAAIAATGFGGRVLVGSWYGQKRASLDLGGHFHRSRIRLLSSQVSTLAPELSARWDKARRFALAWEMLRQLDPARFITQRFALAQAAEAYRLLDEQAEDTIQIVFSYE